MDEKELRALAMALRDELPRLINDGDERRLADEAIAAALARPPGQGKDALRDAMRARPQTRDWVADQLGTEEDRVRLIGLLGSPTVALGVHLICPEGDYDRYVESADEVRRCPNHRVKLVVADD